MSEDLRVEKKTEARSIFSEEDLQADREAVAEMNKTVKQDTF